MSVRPIASNNQSRLTTALLAAALSLAASLPAGAQSVEEFYRKTPVQLLIGFPVANAYDTYGRAVARHLGKHIPGNPTVVPVNRPGAGSLTAANSLYNAAPKDGSTIAHFNRSVPLEPLMGNAAAKFDGRKFTWLGSVGNEVSVCVGWHTAAVKTWSDFLTKDFVAGAAGIGRGHRRFPDGAEEPVRRQDQDHHRLSRRRRDVDRDGARRDRRPLRLVMERRQEQQAGVDQRQADQRPAAARPAEERRASRRPADHGSGHHRRPAPDPASWSSAGRNSPGRSRRRPTSPPTARRRCATPLPRRSRIRNSSRTRRRSRSTSIRSPAAVGREADRRALCGAGACLGEAPKHSQHAVGRRQASKPHRLPFDRQPPHQPRLVAREILAGVDRAPVVPDHEVAELPFVLVDDRRVFGDLEELLERGLALVASRVPRSAPTSGG